MIDHKEGSDYGILLPVPLGEERVFRNAAMDDIVLLLYRNPHDEFGVRQLREVTGHGGASVDTALTLLDQLDLIKTRRDGNRKLVSVNRDRLLDPDDPILAIPQEEFRTPIRAFLGAALSTLEDDLVGVVLFGSVARGQGDRASDIDLLVVVTDDLLAARRSLGGVRQQVEAERFGGDRYEFQVLVESIETATQYGGKLQEIFTEGITLYDDGLDPVRREVFDGG
jgi:hypothetical protein